MDSRAVSSTLSYTLTLAIASLLVTGLLVAGNDFVNDRREEVIREELRVIGEQVAADIARVDRLARAGDDVDELAINRSYPDQVAGSEYDVTLSTSPKEVTLTSVDPEISVRVAVEIQNGVASPPQTVDGGAIEISFDGSDLVIRNV